MTYLAFDIVVAALLLLSMWRSYKKGFILTLFGFLAVFVAFIGATVVSNALAEPVSQVIQPVIEQHIQQIFLERLPEPATPDVDFGGDSSDLQGDEFNLPGDLSTGSMDVLPTPDTLSLNDALQILKDSKLYAGFADAFQRAVNEGMVAATADATRVISDYIAKQCAQMVLFFISFLLILVLWFFLSHALDLAFKLPVLSTLNQWSGAALGLFKGALLLFIACWLLKGSFIPQAAIQNTYLLNFFCTVSPLTLLS